MEQHTTLLPTMPSCMQPALQVCVPARCAAAHPACHDFRPSEVPCAVFNYQYCRCLPGYVLEDVLPVPQGTLPTKQCIETQTLNVSLLVVSIIGALAFISALLALAAVLIRQHRHAFGPPGAPTCVMQ